MRDREDLRDVQTRIVRELIDSAGVMLVLGMGGGKTVCALTAIADLMEAGFIRGAIVIAPKRVALSTWPKEVKQWSHLQRLTVGVLSGPQKRRAQILRKPFDVYTCAIDNLPWLLEELKVLPNHPAHDVLVIDELSRFKNPRGGRAKALNRNSSRFGAIWGLTGTPRPNSDEELWMPIQIISKGQAWGMTFDPWRRHYFDQLDFQGFKWAPKPERLPAMYSVVNDWSVRVPREEVVDVPYVSGPDHDVVVPLSDEARADANSMWDDLVIELGLPEDADPADEDVWDDDRVVALSRAVASGKISQIMQGFLYREGETAKQYDNAKLEVLREYVEDLEGEPVIVCFWYAEDLVQLRSILPDVPVLGSGGSDKASDALIDLWNAGKIPVLALHPASAGHGLNLQFGGARMIWYSVPWSPELYAQTVKRLARPGQTRPVFVHHILADHWYEQLRMRRVWDKVAAQASFIDDMENEV